MERQESPSCAGVPYLQPLGKPGLSRRSDPVPGTVPPARAGRQPRSIPPPRGPPSRAVSCCSRLCGAPGARAEAGQPPPSCTEAIV